MNAFADLIPQNDVAADVIRERDAARDAAKSINRRQVAQSPDLLGDIMLGAKKRALGLGQLTGIVDEGLGQDLAKQYQQRGEGTGARGLIGEMLGDPATYALAAFGAPTNLARMAVMGGAGGLGIGATDPLQSGQDRLTHTLTSGAIGTVAAPVIGKGMQVAGRALEKSVINPARDTLKQAAQWIKSNPKDAIALEIKGLGTVDDVMNAVAGLSDDAKAQFQQSTKSGLTPKQAYLTAKFAEKGGIMTRGQAAQDPALQRLEDQARMGLLGNDAYQVAHNTTDVNKNAFRDWSRELLTDVTGNPNAVVDETTTGDIIGGALKRRYAELKAPVDAAYREGGKTKARVAMQHLADLPKHVRQVMDDANIFIDDTINFKKDFKALEKLTRTIESGKAFHGTDATFNAANFIPSKRGRLGAGVYLSPDKAKAERFGSNLMTVPFRGKLAGIDEIDAATEAAKLSIPRESIANLADWSKAIKEQTRSNLIKSGFSGKKVANEIVIFDPNNVGEKYAIKSVKWNALEKLIQRMNAKAQWETPLSQISDYNRKQDILAYRKLVPELRARQDDLILNDMLTNPDAAAKTLRQAPKLNKAFRRAFEKRSPAEIIATTDMTDKQIADFLGRGVIGKGNTVNFIRGIKTALGDQSDEAIAPIRGTFLNRIMKQAYDKGDDATFGTAIKSELQKLKSQNKQLYDELFTPDQQAALQDFADVAWQASNAVKSVTNPAGSGVFNSDVMLSIIRRMGMGGSFAADAMSAIGAETGKRLQAKQAIQMMTEPFKAIPSDTRIISGLIAPVVAKQTAPKAAAAASSYYGESGGNNFMDTQNIPTRIDVTPADIPQGFDDLIPQGNTAIDNLGGNSGSDIMAKYINRAPNPRVLSGEVDYEPTMPNEMQPQKAAPRKESPAAFGISAEYLQKLAMAESSMNPLAQAKTSSAKGLFQFTDGTWKSMVKKYGDELGVSVKDVFDPMAQAKMAIKFTQENAKILSNKLGRIPTHGELYAAHFLGASGAANMLKHKGSGKPAAKINPAAAKANRSIFFDNGRARSVDEVLAILNRKVQ